MPCSFSQTDQSADADWRDEVPFTTDDLHDIQGIGVPGFKKDQQELIFVRFGDQPGARRLLAALAPKVASAWEVGQFNDLFREVRARSREGTLSATWIGAMISAAGYDVLSVNVASELGTTDGVAAFTAGMAARAPAIGDSRPQDAPTA